MPLQRALLLLDAPPIHTQSSWTEHALGVSLGDSHACMHAGFDACVRAYGGMMHACIWQHDVCMRACNGD
eukprot:365690-Chlamydomonas_euryale.AAC.8